MKFFDFYYAPKGYFINLCETEFKHWRHLEGRSVLTIVWEGLTPSKNWTLEKLRAEMEKRIPEQRKSTHKDLPVLLFQSLKMKSGDVVFGVKEIGRRAIVGHIESVSKQASSIDFQVKWNEGGPQIKKLEGNPQVPFEIKPATIKLINTFGVMSEFLLDAKFKYVKIHTGYVIGRNKVGDESVRIDWNPNTLNAKYMREEIDAILDTEKQKEETSYNEVELFYGTNRKKTGDDDFNKFYGNEGGELITGICKVSIPSVHRQGELERPSWWKLQFREDDENHITVKDVQEVNQEHFFLDLAEDMAELDEKSAIIFIHGYNNSFAMAARRAGQIACDLPFKGLSGFYSWPSQNSTFAYGTDEELVQLARPAFKEFVSKFILQTGVEKLHFIAHSMGNRLLTFSLNELSNDQALSNALSVIRQIVLAAPDIDQEVFKTIILPEFQQIGLRRTLYSSPFDKALHLSETLRSGRPRLGDSGDSIFVDDGLDTIETSAVKTGGINHSNVFDTKELLTDLHYLINAGLEPGKRRLLPRHLVDKPYWVLPM